MSCCFDGGWNRKERLWLVHATLNLRAANSSHSIHSTVFMPAEFTPSRHFYSFMMEYLTIYSDLAKWDE